MNKVDKANTISSATKKRGYALYDDKFSRPSHTLKLDSSQSVIEELKFQGQDSSEAVGMNHFDRSII